MVISSTYLCVDSPTVPCLEPPVVSSALAGSYLSRQHSTSSSLSSPSTTDDPPLLVDKDIDSLIRSVSSMENGPSMMLLDLYSPQNMWYDASQGINSLGQYHDVLVITLDFQFLLPAEHQADRILFCLITTVFETSSIRSGIPKRTHGRTFGGLEEEHGQLVIISPHLVTSTQRE